MRLSKTLMAATALLAAAAISAQADEPSHIPATAQSRTNAAVIAKADHALRNSLHGLSNVWIFATGDANSVFVSYTTDTSHLALVELKDEHIANLHDFNSSTEQVLTASTH